MTVRASVVDDVCVAARQVRPVVLCVDDDRSSREMLRRFLEPIECDCMMAGDGSEALQMLGESSDIALVVTDFLMSEMDGDELCRAIELLHPHLKVIVVSGSSPGQLDSFREIPVVFSVLEKPVQRLDFLSTVYTALETR